jgi:large subunit ribosomal protein L21
VKTGGKQYRVAADDLISVEKLKGAPGDIVELGEVLLVGSDGGIEVGNPFLSGATVAAEIVSQMRSDRIIVFKKRRRHHYRRRNGHRQDLTRIRITEILTGGARPSPKAKAAPEEAAPVATPPVDADIETAAEAEPAGAPATGDRTAGTKSKAAGRTRDKRARKPAAKKK